MVLLSSCAAYGDSANEGKDKEAGAEVKAAVKEDMLLRSLLLAHHPLIGRFSMVSTLMSS